MLRAAYRRLCKQVFLRRDSFDCFYWLSAQAANLYSLVGDQPQPDSAQAVDGMRHVGFRVFLVLYQCICYKNDVILYDQSNS